MSKRLFLAALGATAILAAPAPQAHAQAQAARQDWSRTVVATPEGGFRMGNPNAKVKLVEYGSLTCGHCAAFARSAMGPLLGTYVRTGKVSYEYRNYVLNGLDAVATIVARCGGAARFFPIADKLYATQAQWTQRVGSMTEAQKAQINALPESRRTVRVAELAGLTRIAAQHGLATAQTNRCLADPAALEGVGKLVEAAEAQGVSGTPTFFLNGANIGTHSWATLEPILREAAG